MRFFVYELVDPRTGLIFYVGKGQGKRPFQHTAEAKRGLKSQKCDQIRAILADGHETGIVIVKRFTSEAASFAYEKKLIAAYGRENLTNILPGGGTPIVKDEDIADVRTIAHILLRTQGFSEKWGVYHQGNFLPLGPFFGKCCLAGAKKLIAKRGRDWFHEQLMAA